MEVGGGVGVGGLLSGISVMMCRYAVVKRELVGTTVPESCLLFSGGS